MADLQAQLEGTLRGDLSSITAINKLIEKSSQSSTIYNFYKNRTDSISCVFISRCYHHGCGVEKDYTKGFEYCKRAAEMGNADGHYQLAGCYRMGIGTPIDRAKAVKHYEATIGLGNSMGYVGMGHYYSNGPKEEIDHSLAFQFYKKAADLGNSDGYIMMGYYYHKGLWTQIDCEEGFRCYKKAADLGDPNGFIEMCKCYYQKNCNDETTPKDYAKALKYYNKAIKMGYNDHEGLIDDILGNKDFLKQQYIEQSDRIQSQERRLWICTMELTFISFIPSNTYDYMTLTIADYLFDEN